MYSVKKREFEKGKWIFAKDEFLKTSEKIESIEGAKWIWSTMYSRVYLRKKFDLEKVETLNAKFICDNVFDLFINGKPVSLNRKKFSGDISYFLTEGENVINIRAYQTNDDRFLTSALTGIIEGENFRLVTDKSWESYIPVSFWQNDEPEDWMTKPTRVNYTLECNMHPRAYKHSLYLRRKFQINKQVEKAVIYVSAQGAAELYINSVRTDDEILSDGVIRDFKEYRQIDVTSLLKNGENVIGAITGNAWLNSESHSSVYMNKNMLLLEMEITYEDSSVEYVSTDALWKCAFSPLTDNDLQYGERYDARLEIKNWCEPDYNDEDWAEVDCADAELEIRPFVLRSYPPIRIIRKIKPQKTMLRDTRVIYDFGENCAGRYSILLNNTFKGQEVKISFCERLDEYGEFVVGCYSPVFFTNDALYDGKALGCMRNFDFYTCKGAESEFYEPRFAFSGFRYICVEGIKDKNQVSEIYMNVMHNDLKKTGTVESSYSFINDLFDATLRTWDSNIMNGPMDCPTREKNYWTGDAHIFSATACYLENCDELLARWSHAGRKMCPEVYGWGDEKYIIPWTLYQFYRDKGILEESYEGILDFARSRCEQTYHDLPKDPGNAGFSDWLAPGGLVLDKYFFTCCFYCYMLKIVAQIAEVLGDFKTSDEFTAKIEPAVFAFNKKFMDREVDEYSPQTQSSLVLPLAFDLVPTHRQNILAKKLNERILKDGHLTTGFVATRYLLGILCDYGYEDTAFMLLNNEKYPSWKNMMKGLNSLPESWVGLYDKADANSISMNHFAYGTVVGWMFEYLGGIRYRESTPGFSHVVLRPTFIKEIGSFRAEFDSYYGKIITEWNFSGDSVLYKFFSRRNVTLILPNGDIRSYPAGENSIRLTINK